MTRRLWTSVIGVVLIVIITLGYNIDNDNTPILGLDLQGGVHFLMEVDEKSAIEKRSEGFLDSIRGEVRVARADVAVVKVVPPRPSRRGAPSASASGPSTPRRTSNGPSPAWPSVHRRCA